MHHYICGKCSKCIMLCNAPIKLVRKTPLLLISVLQIRKLGLPKVKVR